MVALTALQHVLHHLYWPANALALLLFASMVRTWWTWRPERRAMLVLAGAAFVAVLVVFGDWVPASAIPIEWLTPLEPGTTEGAIRHLSGNSGEGGPNFLRMADLLQAHATASLRDVVRLNMALGLLNAILFAVIAAHALGSAWAGLLAAFLLARSGPFVLAAVSEQSAQLLALYFQAGIVAAAVFDAAPPEQVRARRNAWILLAVLTWLMLDTRPEFAWLGLFGITTSALRWRLGDAELARRWQALPTWFDVRWSRRAPAVAMGVVLVSMAVSWLGATSGLSGVVAALHNAGLALLTLPVTCYVTGLSPLVLLLAFAAMVGAASRTPRWLILPAVLLLYVQAYAIAAGGEPHAMARYFTHALLPLAMLAVLGWRWLDTWVARMDHGLRWLPWTQAACILGLAIGPPMDLPITRPHGLHTLVDRSPPGSAKARGPKVARSPLVHNDHQIETQFLFRLAETFPKCRWVARVARPAGGAEFQFFGLGRPTHRVAAGATTLRAAVQAHAPKGCLLYYQGIDANLAVADAADFQADHQGLERLDSRSFASQPFGVAAGPADRSQIELAVYRIRAFDPDDPAQADTPDEAAQVRVAASLTANGWMR